MEITINIAWIVGPLLVAALFFVARSRYRAYQREQKARDRYVSPGSSLNGTDGWTRGVLPVARNGNVQMALKLDKEHNELHIRLASEKPIDWNEGVMALAYPHSRQPHLMEFARQLGTHPFMGLMNLLGDPEPVVRAMNNYSAQHETTPAPTPTPPADEEVEEAESTGPRISRRNRRLEL